MSKKKQEFSIIARRDGKTLVFDGKKCGQLFPKVAIAMDLGTENPIIWFPSPLGVNLIKTILEEFERLQKDFTNGLTGE